MYPLMVHLGLLKVVQLQLKYNVISDVILHKDIYVFNYLYKRINKVKSIYRIGSIQYLNLDIGPSCLDNFTKAFYYEWFWK